MRAIKKGKILSVVKANAGWPWWHGTGVGT
jgi:hypothetical protein